MTYRVWGRPRLERRSCTAPIVQSIVLAIALAAATVAQAAPSSDWTYRVRPKDNIWDLAARYLKSDVPWQKLQDYNHVADPLHLPPGMTLHIPVAWLRLEPAKAKVVAVIGEATAKLPDSAAPVPVKAGMSFGYGASLSTGNDTSLTLEFADGSRVLVQANSELALDRLSAYGDTGMVDTRLRLQRGRVNSDVHPLTGSAARFSVSTPGTISSVRGTHFRVIADPDAGAARTEVVGGKVDVGGEKRHVLVKSGRGVATADGAAPGQPQELLPAPAIACPSGTVNQFPLELHWPALAGAEHYRLQLAPDDKFEALLLDRVVSTSTATLPDLPDGSYAVRVRGIGAGALEGLDGVCPKVTIDGTPQPPLIVSPQPDSKVRDKRPEFRWTESVQAVSYRWQLSADAAFGQVLAEQDNARGDGTRAPQALPLGRYYWRVASRDSSGKVGPYTHALPFDLVEEPPVPVPGEPKRSNGDLVLSWPGGTPGQHYHVQLARDPQFAKPEVDATVDKPELDLKKLKSGKWYVRVQTIDVDGYAGPWSPAQKTRISCASCRWAIAGGGAALLWLAL